MSWHHFDPPWHERNHHEPEGMIALCVKHHAMADRGVYTKSQLHGFKKSINDLSSVAARFPWAQPNHLVRIGGIYSEGHETPIGFNGNAIIRMTKDPMGCMELSFSMCDPRGRLIAAMENNMFQATPNLLSDLNVDTGATKIRFRMRGGEARLELSFRFITIEQLMEMLAQDKERARIDFRKLSMTSQFSTVEPRFSGEEKSWSLNRSGIVDRILERAKTKCLNEEGKVALLDFKNMVSYIGGRKLEIRNGLACEGLIMDFNFVTS